MIFHDVLGFFVIHDCFSMTFLGFANQNCFFNESVVFFGLKQIVRRCCGRFSLEFIGFFEKQNLFSTRVLRFWSTPLCFQAAPIDFA